MCKIVSGHLFQWVGYLQELGNGLYEASEFLLPNAHLLIRKASDPPYLMKKCVKSSLTWGEKGCSNPSLLCVLVFVMVRSFIFKEPLSTTVPVDARPWCQEGTVYIPRCKGLNNGFIFTVVLDN